MILKKWFVWGMIATSGGMFATTARAQAIGRDDVTSDFVLNVYPLEQADVHEVANSVQELGFVGRIVANESSSAVVVYATEEVHKQIGSLIRKLDVAPLEKTVRTEHFQLAHRDPEQVAGLLVQVLDRKRTRVAVDPPNQLIIVKGPQPQLESAADLIERVDRPQRALTLSMYFVRGNIGGDGDDPTPGSLPGRLHQLIGPLANNGLVGLSLLAPLTTTVEEGSEFSTAGSLETSDWSSLHFEVHGEVQRGTVAETARFTIVASVVAGQGKERQEFFDVRSTLTAELGDFVVLAAAPSATGSNEAIALIVRAD